MLQYHVGVRHHKVRFTKTNASSLGDVHLVMAGRWLANHSSSAPKGYQDKAVSCNKTRKIY